MNSIKQTAKALIEEKEKFITFGDIIKELGDYELSESELKALIYTDLITNGEFFYTEDGFNLTKNFTLYEISKLKAEYSIASDLEDDIEVEEEEEILVDDFEVEDSIDVEEILEDDLSFDEDTDA